MANRKETIRVEHLTTGYATGHGSKEVTRDITGSLFPGELTCILGPNGSGKSTLLRTLTTFIPPLSGQVTIDNKPLDSYSAMEIARLIGVVLTDRPDVGNMTARELVELGRSPYTGFWGRLNGADRRIVEESMEMVGVAPLASRQLRILSDGERQKVMIAKALAQATPIIFLDEPTAFLDYPSKVEIMLLLRKLAIGHGKTIFLSTHDLEIALQIADKIWLIDKSRGVTIGTPEDLSLQGDLSRYFHREEIAFDPDSGLFKIERIANRRIAVAGHGSVYSMAVKALARRGIRADSDGQPRIIADDRGITLDGKTCRSIEELLTLIDQ